MPGLAFQTGTASLNTYVEPKLFPILFPGEIVPHECVTRNAIVVMMLLDPIAELELYALKKYESIKQEVKPCAKVNSKTPGQYPGFGFE